MNCNQTKMGIDRDYLQRGKQSTTEQKLDWLAAALDFVRMIEKANPGKARRQ